MTNAATRTASVIQSASTIIICSVMIRFLVIFSSFLLSVFLFFCEPLSTRSA